MPLTETNKVITIMVNNLLTELIISTTITTTMDITTHVDIITIEEDQITEEGDTPIYLTIIVVSSSVVLTATIVAIIIRRILNLVVEIQEEMANS